MTFFRRECNSRLYKLQQNERGNVKIEVLQDVQTSGASSVEIFRTGQAVYLVIANSVNNEGVRFQY